MPELSIDSFFLDIKKTDRKTIRISGLYGSADAYLISRLIHTGYQLIAVCDTDDAAEECLRNINTLLSVHPSGQPFFTRSFLSDDAESRIATMGSLFHPGRTISCVVCSQDALILPTASFAFMSEHSLYVSIGEVIPRRKLIDTCADGGYERLDFVEQPGQFAVRGEIIDVWVPGENKPVRIVFPGDSIESIKVFDVGTQRSHGSQDTVFLFPAQEKNTASLQSVFEQNASPQRIVFWNTDPKDEPHPREAPWITCIRSDFGDAGYTFPFEAVPDFQKNFDLFGKALALWKKSGFHTRIFSHNTGEKERLQELLYEHCRDMEEYPEHCIGTLTRGFIGSGEKIVCVANGDIFGRYHKTFRLPRFTGGTVLHSLGDIKAGDYVVHEKYGIGMYRSLEEINAADHVSEYLKLEYRSGDFLYVPVDDFQQVQKFVGGEGYRPRLYSLDGVAWERMKKKVKKGVVELADELMRTQAARMIEQGYAFDEPSHMEKEFADSFFYPETPDQARTIQEVMKDMQLAKPMDRLVCGDVGFGKTEVAMRAAFKAVTNSCQAAVLVPTTILAEQHYRTFTERMADYPVTVGMLSRFQTAAEQKKIIAHLATGTIDIIIGTHRLLQKDIVFKKLKLIIIDEEQRFGVQQKEKFKQQFTGVDILTLSATPIPRTLYMGLSGVKDFSLIETSPEGRQPILTYVGPYDESLVVKAIQMELARGGQIFYVHNRVETMLSCVTHLRKILPSVTFKYVHGQMRSVDIEKTMMSFLRRHIDCLVATSIIESGLDIPSVNTLIVENAQDMGLAQLYQLRGRIGRERQRAHCFLMYDPDSMMTQEARKRLEALKEFTSLGSGFHLAMRDLEIRGAGNIIGARQHGFMKDIGFDLYSRMLQKEIERIRESGTQKPAEKPGQAEWPKLDLKINAFFPASYIPGDAERIRMYRKALDIHNEKGCALFKQELIDRFGPVPLPVTAFFKVIDLRHIAMRLRIRAITEMKKYVEIHFFEDHVLTPEFVIKAAQKYGSHIQFFDQKGRFSIRINNTILRNIEWIEWLKNFLSSAR